MNSKYAMLLNLSDLSNEPLHAQMSRQIRSRVLGGELEEGAALPSIRKMAREQKVSVITVQRAYDDLMKEGLIHSRRGKGFFVSELTGSEKKNMAIDRLRESIQPVINEAQDAGLDNRQIEGVVQEFLDGKVKKQ